ncbi:odorant receptor 131-2-like [Myxocyprinus asiaticus]|uniref:odorant receptor 131-2-like n=1 Tax=Myxocyprinus asiaticus TaxID=70543 RepID=UPI0022236F1E|nr:odorant receptor 131-2-like [Myxocyprinus asiaticus]
MARANGTNESLSLSNMQIFKVDLLDPMSISKNVVGVLIPLFFIYVNCVMLFALRRKPIFHEMPRYILFGHMLMNDSVLLLVTTIMFAIAVSVIQITKAICTLLQFVSNCTFRNAPLTLAVMSLERYVAICFPLRHCNIATPKMTYIALGIIWLLSSLDVIIDIISAFIINPYHLAEILYCSRERLFPAKWQMDKSQRFDVIYFVSVAMIIIFTYISIMVTARSVSSDKGSARKAHRTVLLHLIQLGLCLTSFLYATIENTLNLRVANLRILNYLIVLVLPRCLSPLIYGLRDDAVRPLFKYYFSYRSGKLRPSVNVH